MVSFLRISGWAALLLAVSVCGAGAEARSCRQLQVSLAGTGGGGKAARSYDRAITAQQAAIAETRRRMQAPGCVGWGRSDSACGALVAALPKMQANLRKLRAGRAGMGSGKAERARLRASLEASGCRGGSPKPVEVKATAEPPAPDALATAPESAAIRFTRPAGASSVCVRLCDGYFFPMTRTRAPVDDQTNCEAACPGTPMEVFYQSGGADEAAMSSAATGDAYRKLATAFQFRDGAVRQPEGCGCNRIAADAGSPATSEIRKTLLGAPAFEPAALPAQARRVRVVAPAFLPDPEEAIDLRAPAPSADR